MARPLLSRALCLWLLGLLLPVLPTPLPALADPPVAYRWHEEFLTTPDGISLHADVLRPPGLPDTARTPVVMTVSPYRAHLAYLTEPRPGGGPSTTDLPVDLFLPAGYTYVIVDLRGFGGSSGCPDFGGPGERSDVRTAVEWAAAQPWSTGRVGLIGTSYEGWTGLMGLAEQPRGLAAVAAFEPVADPWSYLYMQGIAWKFSGKPVTENGIRPADLAGLEHLLISATPAHPGDSPEYRANAARAPLNCAPPYLAGIMDHDGGTAFWRDRDLVDRVRGNTIPLFLGQGFVDYNTRADRIFELWNGLGPGEHRAWFGQWGHRTCRVDCGTPQFDTELLAFFDREVAGRDVGVPGPRITVGQFDGLWRSEDAWPPADSRPVPMPLRTGDYTDRGFPPGPDREIWSVSQPTTQDQHLSGAPIATVTAAGPLGATVAVELYDVGPDGIGTVITRGIAPVGAGTVRLLAQDWPIPAGHRIAARITDVVDDVWSHAPAFARVSVTAASVELPLLTEARHPDLTGAVTDSIEKWRTEKITPIGPDVLNNDTVTVSFPDRGGDR